MKKFRVKYFCDIVKASRYMIVCAETKAEARKKFKDNYHIPPTILDIELIVEK